MKIIENLYSLITKENCHKIIKERNKFLIDYNIPRLTNADIIPSSHLPINFIKPIETTIFNIVKSEIFSFIKDKYNENLNNLEINTVFFVENSYEYNKKYTNADKINYSYGFIIVLNENTYYDGGELHVNSLKVNTNNNIIIFDNNDKINFNEILSGEQYKIIGYINNKLITDKFNNNILLYNNPHVLCINDIFENELCLTLNDKYQLSKLENLQKEELISKFTENDTYIDFEIGNYKNVLELHEINDSLSKNKELNETLNKYDIFIGNMLSYKIEIIKKSKSSYYFSPLIKQNNKINSIDLFYNDKESKFTLLININECDGYLTFIDTNKRITFNKGSAILIPNNFLYKFYININDTNNDDKNYGCFLIATFF